MATKRKIHIMDILKKHIISNLKEYVIVLLIFLIGIFLGVMFINNANETQENEIQNYINTYIENSKEGNIEIQDALKTNIKEDIILACLLWFAGTTVIGIPIVFGIILFRGFCLGYTISATISTIGFTKGLIFILTSILLQNLLFIPAILILGVSGIKLYKSIIKDKRRENIKVSIIRHTVISSIALIILILSAIVEVQVSYNFLKMILKYL
jgi:stage II sporulation protein M